jgi:hypothetical protein
MTMNMILSNISLLMATLTLGVIFIAGVRERIVNIPRWFADPPVSFELIRKQAPAAARFWIPVQIIFLVSLITAFITNWRYQDVRLMMIFGTAAFLIVIVLTAAFYVKEIMAFSKIPVDAPATETLLKRANTWFRTTVIRNIIQGVALVFFIVTVIEHFKQ